MSSGGQAAPAWASSRTQERSGVPWTSQWASRRCRWVGTTNIVVGRSVVISEVRRATSKLPAKTSRPPASRVPVAKRSGALWWIGLTTRLTSSSQNPHSARSSSTRAAAETSSRTPLWTALGRPVVPLVTCIGRPRGSPRRCAAGSEACRAPSASGVSTTAVGSTSSSTRARSTEVRCGSRGTGRTPPASRPMTVSTYAVEPGCSSATRSPGPRVVTQRGYAPSECGPPGR